jgi:glycosyltransferase involved in cell wall biosynthesis
VKPEHLGPNPRLALISIGIGRLQRGFERMFTELFGVLKDSFDVTLFKSGGARNSQEKVPPLLAAATTVARALPLGGHAGGATYKADCVAFGLSMLPELLRDRFDVIHCIDPPLAKILSYFQRIFHLRARLLFTEGCRMPPRFYPQVDHVHHVALVALQEAVAMGVPSTHMTMIPAGIHARQFADSVGHRELRRKHAIADSTFVILAVSNVERVFKRVDYIIEEVSRLEGDFLLWIDGHPEDPTLPELATQKLGPRCRITYVASSDVPELYHLADVMVHASVDEGFGRAVVEALCAGLMVLVHDCPHFKWLVQDNNCLVDMNVPGNLTARLRELFALRNDLCNGSHQRAATASQRFDWNLVAPAYVEMYRKVAAMSASTFDNQ